MAAHRIRASMRALLSAASVSASIAAPLLAQPDLSSWAGITWNSTLETISASFPGAVALQDGEAFAGGERAMLALDPWNGGKRHYRVEFVFDDTKRLTAIQLNPQGIKLLNLPHSKSLFEELRRELVGLFGAPSDGSGDLDEGLLKSVIVFRVWNLPNGRVSLGLIAIGENEPSLTVQFRRPDQAAQAQASKTTESALPSPKQEAKPFGVRMGMKAADFRGSLAAEKRFFFKLPNVPRPHEDFVLYLAEMTPGTGLCWLKAVSKEITTNSFGTSLKTEFEKIRNQVESAYGASQVLDRLIPGSIWTEPQEWTMSLLKQERTLIARWPGAGGEMPHPLQEILLGASASGLDKGHISIEYYFENYEICEDESRDAASSVF